MEREHIPVIIPAYKPENTFLKFITSLTEFFDRIIVIDDGSGRWYRGLFDEAEKNKHEKMIRHAVNLGKGRSLKDGFNYVLNQYPDSCGVVTADADGQHLIDDIRKVAEAPVSTVYESKKEHQTHFHPLWDSVAIYRVILMYSFSSILSALIDMAFFSVAIWQGCGIWAAV